MYSAEVRIRAPIEPTEVTERVERAVLELFPGAKVERGEGELRAETHAVETFAQKLREQRILDTARGALLSGREGGEIAFRLKKQAAYEGVVNFAVGNEAELGDIEVEVVVREPTAEAFVHALAPPTDEEGRPVEDPFN
jgi:predicted RNA binding protein with dsRBD fold (UPF0201 family)